MRTILFFLMGATLMFAQFDDVDAGARLFRANCANCHGLEGANVAGVDLGHNKFKRASTDEDLVQIILTGVPGTGMPPNNLPRAQVLRIVEYLRSMASPSMVAGGDVAHGSELFASKGCTNCHRILGTGSRVGPDLSEIGSYRKPADLEKSILDPNAEIQPDDRTFKAVTRDGATITGRVINQDSFTLEVIDSHERLLLIERANLRESSFSDKSGMPSFAGKLSEQELKDLVSYLTSLKRMDLK
jgi:putative heme-binding domain-containing protein